MENKCSDSLSEAKWIMPDRNIGSASPVIRKGFTLRKTSGAKLFITVLGFFEARLNGKKLGNEYFQPVASDYEKRNFKKITYPCRDSFTHRIYFNSYDVSEYLNEGENQLEVQLGGGWYVQTERVAEGEMSFGERCKCIFALETGGGTILSDGSEEWSLSEITCSELFIGEVIDYSAVGGKYKVAVAEAPESELSPSIGAPDRLIRTIKPLKLSEKNGRSVWDAGENISGLVRVVSKAGYTGEVTLRFAEELKDGELDFASSGADYTCLSGRKQIMTDVFVCDGKKRVFEPKFVWHAFRYFDVEGEVDSLEVLVIHADVKVTSTFDSDSEGMNFLYDAYIRTELDNMHGSFPSDCPHRERLGYTGDGQITAKAAMLTLDSKEFYRKWIRDILDCQDKESGHVQHTAPFMGGGGGPGGWGSAMIIVPYQYWKNFGDTDILRECLPAMRKWIGYLESHSEGGLVVREEEGGWCLGDWCTLGKCEVPEPLVNTWYLIKQLGMLREICLALGEPFDEHYAALQKNALDALRERYFKGNADLRLFSREKAHKSKPFSRENSNYSAYPKNGAENKQGIAVYGATLGLADTDACAEYYDKLGHFDTGFLCTDILCELLFATGHGETFYRLLENDQPGGYLYMKRNGATTIWENWKWGSHCHPMFGAPARQLFEGILGIRQAKASSGWERLVFSPYLPERMNFAEGSIETPRGEIKVSLERRGGKVLAQVEFPENITAQFRGKLLSPGVSGFEL